MYRHLSATWQDLWRTRSEELKKRAITWRRQPAITRIEKPSRLDRAHRLGYKAKQGFVVVRTRVGRGGMRRPRPRAGRRPKHLGVTKIKAAISMQSVAERRAAERFPNLKPLGSYFLYKDGKYAWYEVIFVDPHHPTVARNGDIGWVASPR